MISEPSIRIGLITDGIPQIAECGNGIYSIRNLLIGKSFHWQQSIEIRTEGTLIPAEEPENDIHLVCSLPLEKYVASVIGSEMNPNAPIEFLKAHAVISRGWALGKLETLRKEKSDVGKVIDDNTFITWQDTDDHYVCDVCSDDHCQRYQGIQSVSNENAELAVKLTRGLVLCDSEGNIADTRFSKCCGGYTELFSTCWSDDEPEYLRAFEDPWCDLTMMTPGQRSSFLNRTFKGYDANTPFNLWEHRCDSNLIQRRIKELLGKDIGKICKLLPLKKGPSGRIYQLLISGSEGEIIVGKELLIRRLLAETHLYSSAFEIYPENHGFLLRGKGWGHGVGLCQTGAAHMAVEGKSFEEILQFYYPTTTLTTLYE